IILPLPSSAPSPPSPPSPPSSPSHPNPPPDANPNTNETPTPMPPEGHTILLNLSKSPKTTIIRRDDGFEKRVLWRCGRCGVVVGYEIAGQGLGLGGEKMDLDVEMGGGENGNGKGKGKEKEKERYAGRVMYILPGGVTTTDVMSGVGRKIGEGDVDIGAGTVAAFE
ncbi:hypothetical protein LAWI1_G005105, partial [Lachnellula willkommii]